MMLTRFCCAAYVVLLLCSASCLHAQALPPPPPCIAPVCWPEKFYKFEVMAKTDQQVVGAGTLTALGTEPSINDNGVVAFVGQIGAGNFSGLFTANGTGSPTWVSNSVSTMGTTFGDAVGINNNDQIAACSLILGSSASSSLQIWNGKKPGSSTPVASTDSPLAPLTCLPGLGSPSINNSAQLGVVFGALDQASGTVRAFGNNDAGQLGNGSSSLIPNPAPSLANIPLKSGVSVTAVAAGTFHSLALASDGTVWAWGYNAYGQLGFGSISTPYVGVPGPVQFALPPGVKIIAIAAGLFHSLALDSNHMVWAWGDNRFGELGVDPFTTPCGAGITFTYCRISPMQVSGLSGVVSIAAGGANIKSNGNLYNGGHSLALDSNGTVWAWGNDTSGQLGDGPAHVSDCATTVLPALCRSTPEAVSIPTPVRAISAGASHSMALDASGTVWAWGANGDGELGNGTNSLTGQFTPGYVLDPNDSTKPLTGVVAISATGPAAHSLALKSDGTVWAWGDNAAGQTGVNPLDPNKSKTCTSAIRGPGPCVLAPSQVVELSGMVAIAAGDSHSLALAGDGTVWAFGDNAFGELGVDPSKTSNCTDPAFTGSCSFTPLRVLDPADLTGNLTGIGSIAGGNSHSLALHFNQLLATPGAAMPFNELAVTSPVRPAIDDNGNVVVRAGPNPDPNTNPILLYNNTLSNPVTIADTNTDFNKVGMSPGISRDGRVIAFYGDLKRALGPGMPAGPGIFASIDDGSTSRKLFRLTGYLVEDLYSAPGSGNKDGICDQGEACIPYAELGLDQNGNPITFLANGFVPDARIGVTHLDLGPPGIEGDSFVVSFIATPSSASMVNPVTRQPLLFSAQQGLWSMRVDAERALTGILPPLLPRRRTAIPVVQIGDVFTGSAITAIAVGDVIANAAEDASGNVRTQRRGDHRVGFWVSTDAGQMILRGEHLDSDQDGLLDHWEQYGIDIDGDGVPDLDLKSMGADPFKRDVFLQIDWLASYTDHIHELAPFVTQPFFQPPGLPPDPGQLTGMFGGAPALKTSAANAYGVTSDGSQPADIPPGITLHVDAGPGVDSIGMPFSVNMQTGVLAGGNLIDVGSHDDVVYMGLQCGANQVFLLDQARGREACSPILPGLQTRAFTDIKDSYFGLHDKRARELAFHYLVLADSFGVVEDSTGIPFVGSVNPSGTTATALISVQPLPPLPGACLLPVFTNCPTSFAGHILKITRGTGAGQIRLISGGDKSNRIEVIGLSPIPDATSSFVILKGDSGLSEGSFLGSPYFNSSPGNDVIVSLRGFGVQSPPSAPFLASRCIQWRTIAHELGHNFGLRHGGINQDAYNANYKSLMSYVYQTDCLSAVNSYSSSSDVFDDWANLQQDFFSSDFFLGNTFGFGYGASLDSQQQEMPEPTLLDFAQNNLDLTPPTVAILAPSPNSSVQIGGNLSVTFTATDNVQVSSAAASFDINGDGVISQAEVIPAVSLGPNTYQATFPNIGGSSGQRALRALALDPSANTGVAMVTINVANRAPSDTTPPVTIAAPSPGPNANGWNNTNVTVTLNSTDSEPNGTGVKQITYSASGAQTIASTVVAGASTSFTISSEGSTTVSFFGTDNAGNAEAAKSITIRVDTTPPSIFGSRTPAPNQNGWNNTNVTVSFACSDSLSGLASASPPANTVVSTEAAGQSVRGTCTDLAGNSASATVSNINIDKAPPILTVTSMPLPNSNGWNNTDVTVSFAAVDALSGVAMVSAPVTVATEGAGQVVTGSATDLAGNLAVGKVIVNVDKTPPEAFVQFDPVTKDVVLFSRDALSGLAPGPVSPISVQPVQAGDDDEDNRHPKSKEEKRPDDKDSQAEIWTYKVFDLAGNSLVLVEKVRKEERQISARILTLQYGDGPVITLPRNQESFEWEVAKDGSFTELQQEFRTGRSEEDPRVEASFRSRKNETIILQEEPEPRTKTIKPGLDLFRMATAGGKLTIEF